MKIDETKTMAVLIAFVLLLSVAISLFVLPGASAQESYKTFPFCSAIPNPVGAGQETLLYIGIVSLSMRPQDSWRGLTVEVTKPDGTTETLGPFNTDFTGGTGVTYTPTQTGTYYFQTHFPEQVCVEGTRDIPAGTVMEASDSEKYALVVNNEPVSYYPGFGLPTEYWSRPIDAQIREWSPIAGNWLATPANRYAKYTTGPDTGHILWAKPYATGGLVGGERGSFSYEDGYAYEGKFGSTVIINGIIYYNRFSSSGGNSAGQKGIIAVDLRTGKELWFRNNTALSFGQLLMWDSFNYHGTFAYLWETVGSRWNAYDALTGEWVYSMTGVPSGTNVYDDNGNILRYVVDFRNEWLAMWNSTKVVNPQNWDSSRDGSWGRYIGSDSWGRVYPALRPGAIQWNVSIPAGLAGGAGSFAGSFVCEDRLIYTDFQYREPRQDSYRFFAISTAPGKEGTLLFDTTWTPPKDVRGELSVASVEDGVFTVNVQSTKTIYGFDINTGKQIWVSDPLDLILDVQGQTELAANGNYYIGGYGGTLYCLDIKTGELKWRYEVADPYQEYLWANNWGIRGGSFLTGDGKIYLTHSEHSPIDPKPRGAPLTCLDAETGEVIFVTNHYVPTMYIADGIIAAGDSYDNRIYAIGKGPSATTVTAPDIGISLGKSVLIRGTVLDVSAGTKQDEVAPRFPNGVGAVADECMTEWMQYVYKQFPFPQNATGVEVVVSVLDPNNNYYEVGKTTSDASGMYKMTFTPEVPGEYTVIATFMGSGGYWPSQGETAITVEDAVQPTQGATQQQTVDNTWTIVGVGVAIIIAVAIVGVLMMLRKRP